MVRKDHRTRPHCTKRSRADLLPVQAYMAKTPDDQTSNPYLKGLSPTMQTAELSQTIIALRARRADLDSAIAALERLQYSRTAAPATPEKSRRGRKSMGAAERLEVSARMKKYWSARKKERKPQA